MLNSQIFNSRDFSSERPVLTIVKKRCESISPPFYQMWGLYSSLQKRIRTYTVSPFYRELSPLVPFVWIEDKSRGSLVSILRFSCTLLLLCVSSYFNLTLSISSGVSLSSLVTFVICFVNSENALALLKLWNNPFSTKTSMFYTALKSSGTVPLLNFEPVFIKS